jgi:RecA/RadA recombinase
MTVSPEERARVLNHLINEIEVEAPDDDELRGPSIRIPFLSPMLTWATTGGVKIGQTCRWWGPEGSGKSLTNLGLIYCAQHFPEIIETNYERRIKILERKRSSKLAAVKLRKDLKYVQARYPEPLTTLVIDAEGRFEPELARQLGITVSQDTCYPIFENIIEKVVEAIQVGMEAYDIVILDSASACESIETATKDMGEYERGADPRAWRRLKRVGRTMRKLNRTFIIVDQVRTQLGTMGMRGQAMVTPPNVRIIKHMSSLSVEFTQGSKLYLDAKGLLTDDYDKASNDYPHLGTDGKEPHGLEMRCKVMKNSTGRPYRNARMRFKFRTPNRDGEIVQETGFDEPFELLESALEFNMVEKKGSHFYRLDQKGRRTKHKSMHGEAQARARIEEDEALAEEIRQRLVMMT